MFRQFPNPQRAVVIGAGGGIGAAIAAHLAFVDDLHGFSRRSSLPVDLLDESSIAKAADVVGRDIDLVIVATGLLHDGKLQPEKALSQLDPDAFRRVLDINTVGPSLVAKHFLPRMSKNRPTCFAALSARVGSIDDNRLGGWLSYRASKAALNMSLKTIAIEYRRRRPRCVIAGLHPGTVDTALSEPFQANVPEGKLFSPDYAAERLLSVIDGLGPEDSGGTFAWDGKRIPA